MKFSIIASLISATATVMASPVPLNSTATTTPAADVTSSSEGFSVTQTVYPSLQVRWKSKEPNTLSRHTNTGHLLSNPNEKVHTAVYFNIPTAQAAGKTCRLVFRLSQDDWAVGPGSSPAQFDFYRLAGCLNDDYSWSTRLPRGIHAGVITPVKGKEAVWDKVNMSADNGDPYMGAAPTFSCQGGEYSFEMIARPGSNIGWTSGKGSGLSIEICG